MPFGEAGRIRVKTDRMVQGYLDDPGATERMFKDGWFFAQDLGILQSDHRLQVIGRSDDVLNISGHKISPDEVEDWLIKFLERRRCRCLFDSKCRWNSRKSSSWCRVRGLLSKSYWRELGLN